MQQKKQYKLCEFWVVSTFCAKILTGPCEIVAESLQDSFCEFPEKHADTRYNIAVIHNAFMDKILLFDERTNNRHPHKKPAVNFLPFRTPAFASNKGDDEIAAKTTSVLMPLFKKPISLSSYNAGSGLIVPGRITHSSSVIFVSAIIFVGTPRSPSSL